MNSWSSWLEDSFGIRVLNGRGAAAVVVFDFVSLEFVGLRRDKQGFNVDKSIPMGRAGLTPAAFAETLKRQGVPGQDVVVCFPQNAVITKRMRLPATTPEEISSMVALQAARQLPVDPQDILVDYDLIEKRSDGSSEVLMTLVRKEEVESLFPFLRSAGLTPRRILTTGQAIGRFIRNVHPRFYQAMFIHGAGRSLTMGLLRAGRLWAARGSAVGNLTADRLAEEGRLFIESFQKDVPGGAPPLIALLGELTASGALAGLLESALRSPVEKVEFPASALCAVGAASAGTDEEGSFLPSAEKRMLRQRTTKRRLLACAGLAALLLGTLGGYAGRRIHRVQSEIQALDAEASALSPEVKDLRRMQDHIQQVRLKMDSEGDVVDILQTLQRRVPGRVSLTSLIYDRGGSVSLQGTAFSLSDVMSLVSALEKTELFGSVELRSSNSRQWREKEVVDFQVSCGLPRREGRSG